MAFEDIEKLKEKVDKDPNSKLFVPLAEEYKKAGMLDEAIAVLTKGLERQPGYMSARVSLGKVYLEKGMLDEAKAEFEKVISVIPDNLYAHRKLAEIYRDLGEADNAIKEFKTVLRLNPMDEEAATSLGYLEGKPHLEEKPPIKPIEPEPPIEVIEKEAELSEVSVSKEDVEDFRKALFEKGEKETEEVEELPEEDVFSLEDMFKEPGAVVEEIKEEIGGDEEVIISEDITAVEAEEVLEEIKEISEEPRLSISDADSYISQGRYMEAMTVYRRLLSVEPDNKHVLQRIEELRALLKLLGKDKEELIARLNNFLDSIKKRRNEFFRSS
jgi:tetratricopeptide (TPR) repeat protein